MITIVLILILVILVLYIFNNRQSNFEDDDICKKDNLNLITKQGCDDYKKICDKTFDERRCQYTNAAEKIKDVNVYQNGLTFPRPKCNSKVTGYAVIVSNNNFKKIERIDFLPDNNSPDGTQEHTFNNLEDGSYKCYVKSINEYGEVSDSSDDVLFKITNADNSSKNNNILKNVKIDKDTFRHKFNEIMNKPLSNRMNLFY